MAKWQTIPVQQKPKLENVQFYFMNVFWKLFSRIIYVVYESCRWKLIIKYFQWKQVGTTTTYSQTSKNFQKFPKIFQNLKKKAGNF